MKKWYCTVLLGMMACGLLPAQSSDTLLMKQVDSLVNRIIQWSAQKKWDEARLAQQSAQEIIRTKGAEYPDLQGRLLWAEGRLFQAEKRWTDAEKCYLAARVIQQKLPKGIEYAQTLFDLGCLYMDMGEYKLSRPLLSEALPLREQWQGKQHVEYAFTLANLALSESETGQYDSAAAHQTEVVRFWGNTKGQHTPEYARAINNLALTYMRMGAYDTAQPLLISACEIRRSVLGEKHPDYASSLNNLANLYANKGMYEASIPLCIQAKEIRLQTLGPTHPRYAWSVNNLANLYLSLGRYEAAEPLLLEALNIKEQVTGKEHADYAMSLTNLGNLYAQTGNFERAEAMLKAAADTRKRVLGAAHPDYAAALENLANLYRSTGNLEQAEALLRQALSAQGEAAIQSHPEYVTTLLNLANVYLQQQNITAAEPLLDTCAVRFSQNPGKEHPFYAQTLHSLGQLNLMKGAISVAQQQVLKGREIWRRSVGIFHPDFLSMTDLALEIYLRQGNWSNARDMADSSGFISRQMLINGTRHLSEQELQAYLETFSRQLSVNGELAEKYPFAAGICFDQLLFFKGFLQNSVLQLRQSATRVAAAAPIYEELKGTQRLLSETLTQPVAQQQQLAALQQKANDLEKELARSVIGLGEVMQQVTWQEVRSRIPPGEAVVEFFRYAYSSAAGAKYAALLLKPGDEMPIFIPLGAESALQQALGRSSPDAIRSLYGANAKSPLFSLLWQPLMPYLTEVKVVYCVPDGLLHRVAFGAIRLPGEKNVSDRFRIITLGSSRQLTISEAPAPDFVKNAWLFGGIRYDMDTVAIDYSLRQLSATLDIHRGTASSIDPRGALEWPFLKWTAVEVQTADLTLKDARFETRLFTGYHATEEAFKSADQVSPYLIHVATHGFFFEPDTSISLKNRWMQSNDPMMRSGLLLAGANYAWKHGAPVRHGWDDGILTAREISQMYLPNTQLAVLSACETGLGDIQGSEGVYGLQRAFRVAGVRYVMMSLWQAPDYQTQEFMTHFYSAWLDEQRTVPDAFRIAQHQMKQQYNDPFYWAGFVLLE